eukprot:CAMPEP_0177612022 /NCGR_PEP_ID=MMETSP0419_2-20121207/20928_1 /TAXON_ID=582737 /ORGANISM="Tetraselmis sp., Strain GSL018" /LENGTH=750 /DNA_ID=CAMNT_0019108041 /DNA_START=128 /DNA_END=2378 /DNA_ORIENTATION=-
MTSRDSSVAQSALHEIPEGLDSEEQLLQYLTSIPSASKAWCFNRSDGGTDVRVQFSQRAVPANKMRAFSVSTALPGGWAADSNACCWSWPVENSDSLMLSFSPSGQKLLVVKAGAAEADSALLEIWSRGRLERSIAVPKALHGAPVNDGYFSTGASWSPDEERVVYTAESPAREKSASLAATAAAAAAAAAAAGAVPAAAAGPKTWEGVGPWEEDWGELFAGKRPPTLFVLEVGTGAVERLKGLPDDTSCGQPVWDPSGEGVVFVGWPHRAPNFPRSAARLGAIYCYNRPCSLWHVPAVGEGGRAARRLTGDLGSAQAPRFSPSGERLVFLSWNAAVSTGVHNSTAALFSLEWPNGTPSEIVPVVSRPDRGPDGFPGIYAGFGSTLVEDPFLDEDTVAVGSQWGSALAVVAVSLSTGRVRRLTPADGDRTSFTLLAQRQGVLVAAASGLTSPPVVAAAAVGAGGEAEWAMLPLEPQPARDAEIFGGLEHHTLQVTPTVSGLTDLPFETLVVRPRVEGPTPAVLMPHGGPHHAFPAAYMMPVAFLASCGYAVLLVNFRGSTGYGEDCVQSLPGEVGTLDVADCMDALSAAVAAGFADPDRVAVCGGSHGGFLTGHLVGQHPEAFRAGILRNPVVDLGLMVFSSDIPDWTFVESWGTAEGMRRFKPRPDEEDLRRFSEVSPIRYVDSVTAPLLFMLGAKDLRVPWSDARHYMAALRSRPDAPEAKAWLFPDDSHALDHPQTEFEQWMNALDW